MIEKFGNIIISMTIKQAQKILTEYNMKNKSIPTWELNIAIDAVVAYLKLLTIK